MPGVSIHVVDVSRGLVATGLRVELCDSTGRGIADGLVNANGVLAAGALNATFAAGYYVARFHVADYYRDAGVPLPAVPFLDIVDYRFAVSDPMQHYHLPFKMTPWGYSCFRGGA